MRVLYFLLLLCLLFSPGVSLLTSLSSRYPEYTCAKKGGTCHFSSCPRYTKIDGTCYKRKAKCCV